jgi:salicylate biosynthesis isochorismate synthase/menaquinone-specific isochorismate synthase
VIGAGSRSAFTLGQVDRERLVARLELAVRRARRSGAETLASISLPLPADVDPSAVVCASRRPGEPWFAYEQPDREGSALAALGEVARLSDTGRERFATSVSRWRNLAAAAVGERADSAPRKVKERIGGGWAGRHDRDQGGPVAVGGFAFAPGGGASPAWDGFEPASLVVPEVVIRRLRGRVVAQPHWPSQASVDSDRAARSRRYSRRPGDQAGAGLRDEQSARMILTASLAPDDTSEDALARLERRLSELRQRPLPLLDPAPAGGCQVVSAMPPEHYEAAVARATELIDREEVEKIVLAREVQVHAPRPYDPGAVLGVLRDAFPGCFCFCVGRGEATLIAASPELLVRREGRRVSTLALAGSTRRSADPAVDDHLGEQLLQGESSRREHAIVARRIERMLRPHAIWVATASEPAVVRIANIQHLATPIRAQLAAPMDALELVGLMHPTPAVGGEPLERAEPLIPALEGLDRGWYTGPVGWTDATGDGEFCVALRCALLRGTLARCYAGNGIVRASEPAAELAETEVKLAALLPLLAG